jgi:iron complex transport system substrate-binding protein
LEVAAAGCVLAAAGGLGGCSAGSEGASGSSSAGASGGPSTKATDLQAAYDAGSADVQLFCDSAGRSVALPANITAVSPSGAYAQILLCTLCPEKLISLSSRFSDVQLKYLDPCVSDLPILGRFYGKNADLNYEEIIKMSPDVIIDIGEPKDGIADDMNTLQEQTGLPCIFIEATLMHVAEAYRMLGEGLGCDARAQDLATYIDDVLEFAQANQAEIQSRNLRAMYSTGAYGYEVKEAGSIHAAPLELVGIENVAVLEGTASTEVSPEQVMLWAPEILLLSESSGFYDYVYSDATWAQIPAVVNGRVYEVPGEPYEWMDKPPSVQTVLGVEWLGNLLAPDIYNFDMVERTCAFYKLFWNYNLDEDAARALLHLE